MRFHAHCSSLRPTLVGLLVFAASFPLFAQYDGSLVQVDAGAGAVEPGWTSFPTCGTFEDVGGSGLQVTLETGNPDACDGREPGPGDSGVLPDVEADLLFADNEVGPPGADISIIFDNLVPGETYILQTFHNRSDEGVTALQGVEVTGADDFTAPDSITQGPESITSPGEVTFTAGDGGQVSVRYIAPDPELGSPREVILNGFTIQQLGGGGAYDGSLVQVDAGAGAVEPGWASFPTCGTFENVGGSGLQVTLETGNPDACDGREPGPGDSGVLPDVEADLLFANDEVGPPGADISIIFDNLVPGESYILQTFHNRSDEGITALQGVEVTGADDFTAPDSITQGPESITSPGEVTFTAGDGGQVSVRYIAPDPELGSPREVILNGFTIQQLGPPPALIMADAGGCDSVQEGWVGLDNCGLFENLAGSGIDVTLETGVPEACSCRNPGPGDSGVFPDVEKDLLFADNEVGPPGADMTISFAGLVPGGSYMLRTFHNRSDEGSTLLQGVEVTGAADFTAPDSIAQGPETMTAPGEVMFTAGDSGQVSLRYIAPDPELGSPREVILNGFMLFGPPSDGGPPEPPVEFVRSDANDDGVPNIADAIWIVEELFRSGPEAVCQDAGDANDDGLYDSSDAIYVINFQFVDGSAPPAPFPDCGVDATDDALACDQAGSSCQP